MAEARERSFDDVPQHAQAAAVGVVAAGRERAFDALVFDVRDHLVGALSRSTSPGISRRSWPLNGWGTRRPWRCGTMRPPCPMTSTTGRRARARRRIRRSQRRKWPAKSGQTQTRAHSSPFPRPMMAGSCSPCPSMTEQKKVEPGGIEPPSRVSQHAASTRVSGGLISMPRACTSTLARPPANGVVSRADPRRRRISASLMSSFPPLSGVARRTHGLS